MSITTQLDLLNFYFYINNCFEDKFSSPLFQPFYYLKRNSETWLKKE